MKSRMLEHLRRCNSSLKVRSFATYRTFLEILLRSIEHPVAQSMLSLLKEKAYTDLVVLADSVSSTEYRTAAEHRLLNQLSAVVRKYPWPVGSVNFDPRAAATDTFYKSERRCARSNRRFALFDSLRAPYNYDLSLSRNWIQYVLGDLKLSDVWSHCDFGPGASIGIHGGVTNSARKILSPSWTVSPSAFDYARSAVMQDKLIWEALLERPGSPHYSLDPDDFSRSFRERSSLIDYNKIAFVPKTAKTERTIAVEPLLNGYVQKGIDVVMRKKLKRVGIDLQDQTRNQRLAREGSLKSDDPYVTIDLSSASDSISIGLCKHILPPDWFDFLDSVRSKHYLIDNRLTRYNKFVSMGNGFCFPLETLIFASLCEAAYQKSAPYPITRCTVTT